MRYVLFVLLRSILLFVVIYGVYRLFTRTLRSFWEGLTGHRQEPQAPQPPPKKKIEYRDVQDAKFKDDKS